MNLRALLSLCVLLVSYPCLIDAFLQSDESLYLNNYNQIIAKSYAQPLPQTLLSSSCKTQIGYNATQIILPTGAITAARAQALCGTTSICVVPKLATLTLDGSLVVGALLNYGTIIWTSTTQTSSIQWLCAGYVVTDGGIFTLDVEDWSKQAIIYIKNNGATHASLRTRVFGGLNGAHVTVSGTPMTRTWSLLSRPVMQGATTIALMHDVNAMGWHIGDRIVIAPTTLESSGTADVFTIGSISGNTITLATAFPTNSITTTQPFSASQSIIESAWIAQQSAEVMDMTRNVLITGDDFVHRGCVAPMAVPGIPGGMDSTQDCTCINPQAGSYYRTTCTVGLHTVVAGVGSSLVMTNTRVEKCGQRGILGKYCIHLHEISSCPTCVIRGNSIEYGHHRGITVHGTHAALVQDNVISDVRGANIYIEVGNEMFNQIRYNVAICPWPLRDIMHGCTIPGTDEDQADTELNQAGIWGVSFTNDVVGNRFANSFNGMLYQAQGFETGRDDTLGRECTVNQQIGRLEGNTFHGHGRFGTYFLSSVYPKQIDRTVTNDGLVPTPIIDATGKATFPSCAAFSNDGTDRGVMYAVIRNVDYGCSFVGQYNLGDIQYREHTSIGNEQSIYWKEVKNPADGCTPLVLNSYFYGTPYVSWGNIALPGGHGTIVLDTVTLGGWITFESNHHCGVGVTGVLCMPTYVFVKPNTNAILSFQYIWGANNGAMWNLSPDDGMNPTGQMFPAGYISLANPFWTYLLPIDNGTTCISSASPSIIVPILSSYGGGLLCKRPLRRLEVYTPNLISSMNPPRLRLELWQGGKMISYVIVPFWQIDQGQTGKNGYGMTVIPGLDHSYRLMREDLGPIPMDWVIEFSDPIFGNRWVRDEIYLTVVGRNCPTIVHSLHDRRMTWYDSDNHPFAAGHGACTTQPDMPAINCQAIAPPPNGMSCPNLCPAGCNNGYCDCGRGVCQCEAGFSGPNCASDVCATAGCDPVGGRCATRYLGGTLQPVEASCVCRDGFFGPKCNINPCQGQTCSGHGKCQAMSQTSTICTCDAGWGGANCSLSCTGSISGYRMYVNNNVQMNIYARAPAATATECRDQCTSDGTNCMASSFYNSNYCARMTNVDMTAMAITSLTITSTLLQAIAASTVLFVKCGVAVPAPTPTTAVTVAPTTTTPTVVVTTTSTPTSTGLKSSYPGTCVNGFITYTDSTYDLMGLTYTSTTTATACLSLCAAMDATSCAAAVWYNMNACVRYTAIQAQGKTISASPDPTLPRTLFVRCTATPTTTVPATIAPSTQAPATKTPTIVVTTTAPTTTSSTSGSCINGFQSYPDTTWDLMGLPNVIATSASACQAWCSSLITCVAAVWYNYNACVMYNQAQTVGQVMTRSPDPSLPRTLIVRCTATATTTPTTTVPTTQTPTTRTPTIAATTAPTTTVATTTPTTTSSGSCINGFQSYPDTTWDLMGLPYVIATSASACQTSCSNLITCVAAVWYNYNACVLYNQAQTVGQVMTRSPDPSLPRTLIVRCTSTSTTTTTTTTTPTTTPTTKAPTTAPTTTATTTPTTKSPTTAPTTTTTTTTPATIPGQPACISGFQTYSDSTYNDLMGLPFTSTQTAAACMTLCASKDATTCAGAVWYNFNACVLFNAQQVIGKTIVRSPDPSLPRTTFVRCVGAAGAMQISVDIPDVCSNVVCSIPSCINGTSIIGLAANPSEGICCDLYACHTRIAASIPVVVDASEDQGIRNNMMVGLNHEDTSSSSSHAGIIGITVGMGVLLIAIGGMIWYRRVKQSSIVHITPRIRVNINDDGHDDDDKESGDIVTAMIPFTTSPSPSPTSPQPSPSPASSMMGISPVLRGFSPSFNIPVLTPLSSIALDSPSPHMGTMSHRHPLRPSTSATSLLDPRTLHARISPHEGEQQQKL